MEETRADSRDDGGGVVRGPDAGEGAATVAVHSRGGARGGGAAPQPAVTPARDPNIIWQQQRSVHSQHTDYRGLGLDTGEQVQP